MEVRFEAVRFAYPEGVRALDGVELVIPSGATLGVMGANGSGKTTLARHCVGLLRPIAGRVVVGGVDAATLRVAELAARVGLGFQDPDRQIFARSVLAEVAFGPRQLGRRGAALGQAVDAALALTGLALQSDQHPGDLGAASRKLLTIASVLAMETPVVVLDEPTVGLDRRGVERVEAILAGLRADGRTSLVISHDARFVAEACERVILLESGRVILDGSPAEVFDPLRWPLLDRAGLEPPASARMGAALGLGTTPTEAGLLAALRGTDAGDRPQPAPPRHRPAT